MRDLKKEADISVYCVQVCFYDVHKSVVLGDKASTISRIMWARELLTIPLNRLQGTWNYLRSFNINVIINTQGSVSSLCQVYDSNT
jgi:hypothetical protein